MSHSIRRARNEDHSRIIEIRNTVKENVLGEASRPTVDRDYAWFRDRRKRRADLPFQYIVAT